MRVLLAVNHEEIEDYVASISGVEIVGIVRKRSFLLQEALNCDYQLAVVAGELEGDESMEELMAILLSHKTAVQRVAYLYGQYDENCDAFIKLLESQGIDDYYVGAEVPSNIIDSLILQPLADKGQHLHIMSRGIRKKKQDPFKIKPFGKIVISLISNQSTGKSHTAWNLGYCFSELGCTTGIINIDRGYTANLYWHIDELYYDLMRMYIAQGRHKDIAENCWKLKKLNIITGRLGDENEINQEDFLKILYGVRTRFDITIIDTRTGLSDTTSQAIKNSTYDLLVFDCDIMHYHMNMLMIDRLKDEFIPEKTIAVINNTDIRSARHKLIYNELIGTGLNFKDILPISTCGLISCEAMHTNKVPYQIKNSGLKNFRSDIDNLVMSLSGKSKKWR